MLAKAGAHQLSLELSQFRRFNAMDCLTANVGLKQSFRLAGRKAVVEAILGALLVHFNLQMRPSECK